MTKDPDIVERLRDIAGEWADAEIREEAADEIARLKAERNRATTLASQLALDVASHVVEVERLRQTVNDQAAAITKLQGHPHSSPISEE